MGYAAPRRGVFPVGGVMRELVDQGICLVGDALAVSIHIDTGKGGGADRVLAELPHLIEHRVGAMELCLLLVEWHMHSLPPHSPHLPPALHLNVSEGEHLAYAGRHEYGIHPALIGSRDRIAVVGPETEWIVVRTPASAITPW